MKVLFLTRYPIDGASSRYRVYQYLPALRALGVTCDVSSFMDRRLYALSVKRGAGFAKIVRTGLRTGVRLAKVLGHRQYDIVYMQRELLPFGGAFLEHWLKRQGARLVYDYDDALFIKKPSKHNRLATHFRQEGKVVDLMRTVDMVVAGNDYLRDTALENGAAAAVTLHVAEDADRVPARRRDAAKTPLVVGWLGSPSTEKYLELIRGPLERFFAARPNAVLRIMGGGDFRAAFPVEHVAWSIDGEIAALQAFDIGIMPLPPEEWSLGKSGGKARTYMAAGIPAVCERIGYNVELIDSGRTGMLVQGQDEWLVALEQLADDPALRERIGEAARDHVRRHFSIAGQAAKLRDILRDVAAKPARRNAA